MKNVDTMHMYAARKIARKTSEKTLNLKGEMYFATETRLDFVADEDEDAARSIWLGAFDMP